MKNVLTHNKRAFTLIEVLVSVSIFALVMIMATGSVFSIVSANKKAHSLKSVMTNLNFALESMMREIRVGSLYSCDSVGDCLSGGDTFQFQANRDVNGDGVYDSSDQIIYSIDESGHITKEILGNGNTGPVAITADEIVIEALTFYVVGTSSEDDKQPKVVISIQGYAGEGETRSSFNIQTMVSQRVVN